MSDEMTPLERELADLQCLESCEAQGFTIQDWIDVKKKLIVFMSDTSDRDEDK